MANTFKKEKARFSQSDARIFVEWRWYSFSYFSVLPEEPATPDGVPGLFYPLLVHGVAGFHVFGLHVPQVDLPLKASCHQLVPHDVGTVEG